MKSAPENPQSYCTTHEAARMLGVTIKTVQLWAEKGLISCWKTGGGHRRIARESIEKFVASQQRSGNRAQPRSTKPVPPGDALRILIVEDEPTFLRLYRLQLARWSVVTKVTTANNGIEALVRIGFDLPDLIIADLYMPEMDGFQMVRTLRRMPELDSIEIVVVTGLEDESIAAGGLPSGIPIFKKPIPFPELENFAKTLAARLGRKIRSE